MDPPSYDEASRHPPALVTPANIPPPPSYAASLSMPSTPPPTYGETVTIQPDPFPLLASSPLSAAAMSHPQHPGNIIIHPSTQIGVRQTVGSIQNQTVVVVQPRSSGSVAVASLTDVPTVITCPHCHNVVTTKVTYSPGMAAWCTCLFLAVTGLVCGCCLIPLMMRGMQDAHHSCPHCGNSVHKYKR
ncbi:lipopolysaccharide-induced tumor necrosis factor-alpha factor homolog [Genypterus blacodes]|uniref:lipopolysaccharide-induced tumor necrosis factor-alpha factor homolog n=1 Tax=Genypterus blacodes TaxID=154954 RepID=UPI003F775C67